jgi:patatin-like phospholipase/acyl hydrolase
MNKLEFIKTGFPSLLKNLQAEKKGKWGVLNGQQMVEHMSESINMATGNVKLKILTPAKYLEKSKCFAMSDKPFKENTPNSTMPTVPSPVKKSNMEEAIAEYKETVANFTSYFESHKGETLTSPFFGELNYEEWLHLLHKHSVHHAKQFELLK